jgi:5-methylcytosine-specific restriction endonuclease McrA
MTRRVLVLNQDYSPLTICSVERAFVLLYLNKAELLNEVEGKQLRTVSTTFPYPSVVRILNYANIPYRGVVLTRHNIFRRDEFQCQYCGSDSNLTLDHLIPRSKGGKSNWNNLVTACKACNAKKGDNTPEEAGMKLAKNPVKPSYLMFLRKSVTPFNEAWLRYLEPKAYA